MRRRIQGICRIYEGSGSGTLGICRKPREVLGVQVAGL